MTATIGRIEADGDLDDFLATFEHVFGISGTDAGRQRWKRVLEPERLVVARADGRIVATSGAYTFETTLPAGDTVGCAGVTLVSVRADHRRRGVLRAMMRELLDDAAARDEPLAALWASEHPIYGRFGFGPAVPTTHLTVERAQARFRVPAPVDEVVLVDADEAARRFPAIHEALRRQRPVLFAKTEGWWGREFEDPPERREGAGEKRFAVLGDRAYAIHRLRGSWSDAGVPTGTVEVQDLVALDPEASASIWRFVIDTDLSSRTVAGRRPADEVLLHLLDDPARAMPQADWALQVRLVDVAAALAARGYLVDGELTLAVHDDLRPDNDGRWRLVARDGRATCEPTTGDPQLELDVEALATVALGGVRLSTLVAAGRVVAHDPTVVPTADLLLASSPLPWHGGMF